MRILLALILLVGCATVPKMAQIKQTEEKYPPFQDARTYHLTNELKVIVVNVSTLEAMGLQQIGTPYLRGLYDDKTHTIYVPFSTKTNKFGQYMPDFEVLGHEFFHALTGAWHE